VLLFLLATATVFGLFAWQGRNGFNLWDEGYLWYGVQRVLDGEVPLRDFLAYDPGRYYWAAAWMGAWHDDGIMSLRVAVAVFQLLGLFVGLQLVSKSAGPERSRAIFLLVAALTFAVWMFPRHKLFDISISILLVGVLRTWFIDQSRAAISPWASASASPPCLAAITGFTRRSPACWSSYG
jgi:hypothetical protein